MIDRSLLRVYILQEDSPKYHVIVVVQKNPYFSKISRTPVGVVKQLKSDSFICLGNQPVSQTGLCKLKEHRAKTL